MRIGYFGGTFDPPHRGHLAVAQAAARAFSLDRVYLAPTGIQPLKPTPPVAAYIDRLAMVTLLCEGYDGLEPSDLEKPTKAPSPNYTIDTLRLLRSGLDHDDSLFVIGGIDSFLTLPRWRKPAALLEMADWLLFTRPGFDKLQLEALHLSAPQLARVHLLDAVHDPASSTLIRARLASNQPCSALLPAAVERYIRNHHLYGT